MNLETVGKEVNLSSLADVLATHDVDQILAEINANGIGDKFTSVLMFGDSDIKAVSKAVKSKGYKDKGLFLNKEAGYVYMLLNDISDTQKEVKSLTGMQKMMRVLDGNKDGVLNAVTEAKYGEAQTLSVLEWMAEVQRTVSTEAQFDKLLRSIGFNPVSFKQNLDTNFFVTRLNFTEALKANQNMLPSLSSLAG